LREVKRINPKCHITFFTRCAGVINGLPFIDEVREFDERPPKSIPMTYEHYSPLTRHIARIMGEVIGLSVRNVQPSCAIDRDLVDYYSEMFLGYPYPRIIVNRNASSWTPNKEWPNEYWDELISSLAKKATVIEIGVSQDQGQGQSSLTGDYVSLVGKTPLANMIAAIAAADLLISPISGPVHVAAAAGVRSVVIYGGYEHPVCTKYPGNTNLYSPLPCSPCWLQTPCPYDRVCLRRIAPHQVERAVWSLTDEASRTRKTWE
jgi:hypothetical protein